VVDVLLTHSYHLYYDRKQARKMQPYPPLGTLYAAALLRQHGISVALFDSMLEDPERGFPAALRRHRPRIVAVYEDNFNFLSKMCLTRMREVAFGLAEASKSAGAITLVNGSDATDHLDDYLHRGFDFALLGEAEWSLLELVRSLLDAGGVADREAIQGLAFLDASRQRVIRSAARPLTRNLDALPFPARDLVDMERYRSAWREAHGHFSLNLVASRGCPYRCNWCAKPIYGNSFHLRSAASVAEEMRELKQVYGAEHLWFADDIFALKSQWAIELAEAVERRDAALPFKVQSRVDLMNSQTVGALARAGCAEMWMGVESGAQKVVNAMNKGTHAEQVGPARELLREHAIRACYFLQFGYPGETWKDIQKTIALVRRTRPDDIGVSVSYPLPGTEFYDRVGEQLGEKTNWRDSEDLSIMFKSPYTDEFYRALRDALHAEVDSWNVGASGEAEVASKFAPARQQPSTAGELWSKVEALERTCRNPDPTRLPVLQWSEAVT
jgi:anaerobic magnesium-protoporphyrin IX monomethyl ester cyclase